MDIRGTKMEDNGFFHDTYDMFFERYNQGDDVAEATDYILKLWQQFGDFPDHTNILFALALAQWETKSQDPHIYETVKTVIEKGWEIEKWRSNGSDESTLQERKIVLDEFLTQISTEREKAKMRVRSHIDENTIEIIRLPAPDNLKVFIAWEDFTDIKTVSVIKWTHNHGATAVFDFDGVGKFISVKWLDNSNLEVTHDKNILFNRRYNMSFGEENPFTITYVKVDGRSLNGETGSFELYE